MPDLPPFGDVGNSIRGQTMRVALYARVSSERQAERELSIPSQLKSLGEYASRNGHTVVREFVDEAETGRNSDRPAFKEMIALSRLKHTPFEAILVWKLSRFARNREDSIIYKSLLRKHGIQVISINEPIEDSPSGRLLEGIIEVIDEFYSANLAQDVIRGMRDNAANGYFTGGQVPYGYMAMKINEGQTTRSVLQPDQCTAPIVERMFSECLAGKGIKEIAKGLNKDGIPSRRGKRWGITSVYQTLTNEVHIGTLVWGRSRNGKQGLPVRVENAWPANVDAESFHRAQAILASRSPKVTHPRSVTSQYLLAGLIRCAECDASMIGHAAKSGQFFYYRCGNALRRGPQACSSRWLPKSKIEGFVVDRIKGSILTDENLTELIKMTNEEIQVLSQDERDRLLVQERQIKELDARLQRLYDALETGKLTTDDLAPRIKALLIKKAELEGARDETIEALQTRQFRIEDIQLIRSYVEDLRALLGSASILEQKAFLRSFVKRIDVSNSEVKVDYTLPMPPIDSDTETVPVLAIIQNGWGTRIRT